MSSTVSTWSKGSSPQEKRAVGGCLSLLVGILWILLKRRPSRLGYLKEVDRVSLAVELLEFKVRVTFWNFLRRIRLGLCGFPGVSS